MRPGCFWEGIGIFCRGSAMSPREVGVKPPQPPDESMILRDIRHTTFSAYVTVTLRRPFSFIKQETHQEMR